MTITKTTSKTYDVKFFPGFWTMPHAKFLQLRKQKGMSTAKFEKCFCCGSQLPPNDIPTMITVDNGIGNRFACAECTAKEKDGKNEIHKNQ